MLRFERIKRTSNTHRFLLNDVRNRIDVALNEYEDIIPSNNSKRCRNKYKNIQNLHRIIQNGVLKGHKNVYFYKYLLHIAEKRKNDLSLYQINIILKALIRANIYRFVLLRSFEIPILKYVNHLNVLINDCNVKCNKCAQTKYMGKGIYSSSCDEGKKCTIEMKKRLHLMKGIQNFKKRDHTVENNLNVEIISDQFNILLDIFKNYMYVVNFHFSFLCETLFFFITKNYEYAHDRQSVMHIVGMYLERFLSNYVKTTQKGNYLPNPREYKTQNMVSTPNEKLQLSNLYRHKYRQNINVKMVGNYIIVSRKSDKNKEGEKKSHYFNPIFCKNNILSICKYMIMLILKNNKLVLYCKKIRSKEMTKKKNIYISNGYMYKMKNANSVLNFQPMKYLLKIKFIDNIEFLKGRYFSKDLMSNLHFLLNLEECKERLNLRSNIFTNYVQKVWKTQKKCTSNLHNFPFIVEHSRSSNVACNYH
ncbi:hypothetical protein, conserved [Plasmodium gonderi]|uniref:Uncharacterized protein n=1 Tax=Plasmodium gonderi TaxID=77519 RepID=A0A1Y1JK22_PLAGO|nr:hypothetical protein, conserved [Plasmodium gonderi]GAW82839.1 hypothetical protein, conserved [Plasmodium gonderi]